MTQAHKSSTFSVVVLGFLLGLLMVGASGCWGFNSLDLGGCKYHRRPKHDCEAACLPAEFEEVLRCVRVGAANGYLGVLGLNQATVYGLGDKGICRGQTAHFFEVIPDLMQPDPNIMPTLTACDTGEQLPIYGLTVYDLLTEVADPAEPVE